MPLGLLVSGLMRTPPWLAEGWLDACRTCGPPPVLRQLRSAAMAPASLTAQRCTRGPRCAGLPRPAPPQAAAPLRLSQPL